MQVMLTSWLPGVAPVFVNANAASIVYGREQLIEREAVWIRRTNYEDAMRRVELYYAARDKKFWAEREQQEKERLSSLEESGYW